MRFYSWEFLSLGEDPQFFPREPDFLPSELQFSSEDEESQTINSSLKRHIESFRKDFISVQKNWT